MTTENNSTLRTDLRWIGTHLLLLSIVIGLAFGAVYKFEGLLEKHDLATEAKYNSLLAAQAQQNQTIESQLTAQEQHYEQIEATLLAQNASVTKTIATQNQQTQSQVNNDATLDAQQAAARISQQTSATSGQVVAQNSTVVLALPIARDITADLDMLVGVQANLADTQEQLRNETQIATDSQATVTQQTVVIAGLNKQNTEEVAACTAEVAAINKKNRRSKIKSFFIGAGTVAAIVVGAIVKHAI